MANTIALKDIDKPLWDSCVQHQQGNIVGEAEGDLIDGLFDLCQTLQGTQKLVFFEEYPSRWIKRTTQTAVPNEGGAAHRKRNSNNKSYGRRRIKQRLKEFKEDYQRSRAMFTPRGPNEPFPFAQRNDDNNDNNPPPPANMEDNNNPPPFAAAAAAAPPGTPARRPPPLAAAAPSPNADLLALYDRGAQERSELAQRVTGVYTAQEEARLGAEGTRRILIENQNAAQREQFDKVFQAMQQSPAAHGSPATVPPMVTAASSDSTGGFAPPPSGGAFTYGGQASTANAQPEDVDWFIGNPGATKLVAKHYLRKHISAIPQGMSDDFHKFFHGIDKNVEEDMEHLRLNEEDFLNWVSSEGVGVYGLPAADWVSLWKEI